MRRVALLVLLLLASVAAAAPAPTPRPARKKEPDKPLQDQQTLWLQTLEELGQAQNGQPLILRVKAPQQAQGRVRVLRLMQQVPPPAQPK
jgi:hypothetical protein